MGKKLTYEQAKSKDPINGPYLYLKYNNSNTLTQYKCKCGKIFKTRPSDVWLGKTTSCGCQHYNNTGRSAHIKNRKFGRLIALEYIKSDYKKQHIWKCICDCGNIVEVRATYLLTGETRSCGCLLKESARKPKPPNGTKLIGKKINCLTIIELTNRQTKHGGYLWKCRCDCGQITYYPTGIINGKKAPYSCGNCNLKINGRQTSIKSLLLKQYLPIGAIHNYQYSKYNLDWVFVYNGKKVVVEYDEWFWHGHKLEKDNEKIRFLLKNNWYIIKILASSNSPSKAQIVLALQLIISGLQYTEIILPNWGIGDTIQDRKQEFKGRRRGQLRKKLTTNRPLISLNHYQAPGA